MSRMRTKVAFGALTSLLVIACGSGDGSSFGDGTSASEGAGSGQGSSFDTNGTNGTAGDIDPASVVGAECAGTHAGLNGLPLRLVLLLDRSSSMKGTIGGASETKWAQAKAALSGFFGSAQSSGITIDIVPFPTTDEAIQCDAAQYGSVSSDATGALPSAAASLDATLASMPLAHGTPTRPALDGAIAYAQGLQKSLAGKSNVSVILATDGEPTGCAQNAISDVANAVGAVKDTLKTYVIGLGDNLDNLNAIAASAGTNGGKAFLVTSASTSVTDDLTQALGTIRSAALTCSYAIPAAPEGKSLDFNLVNVVYGTAGGKTLVKHSPDCSDASGWRYDDESAPTQILLCAGSCGVVKGPTVTSLDVVLGCATNGSVPVN